MPRRSCQHLIPMVLKLSDKGEEQKYRYIQYVPHLGTDTASPEEWEETVKAWDGQVMRRQEGRKRGKISSEVKKTEFNDKAGSR